MKRGLYPALFLFGLFLTSGIGLEAADVSKETESNVPELMEFHEVIYPIWHTAYPTKDYAALRGYLAEVNARAQKVFEAKLPGILRDKENRWQSGVAEFKKVVAEFNQAVSGNDDDLLLKTAENMHSAFEMLVRIIRSEPKEVEAFHKLLYVVFHRYLPEKQFDQIKNLGPEMVLKAEAITQAKLSKRWESKQELFNPVAAALLQEVRNLDNCCRKGQNQEIEQEVQAVHRQYLELVKIFE